MPKRWAALKEIAAEIRVSLYSVQAMMASEGWLILRADSRPGKRVFIPTRKALPVCQRSGDGYLWESEFVRNVVKEMRGRPLKPALREKTREEEIAWWCALVLGPEWAEN